MIVRSQKIKRFSFASQTKRHKIHHKVFINYFVDKLLLGKLMCLITKKMFDDLIAIQLNGDNAQIVQRQEITDKITERTGNIWWSTTRSL